ncbi:MAG: lysine--tRNA ligase [bacterium]|nr:lysine--tRNA ligase [bacterium]
MASLDDIRVARLAKLKLLQDKGINPYPVSTHIDVTLKEASENFEKLSTKKKLNLAGRIMALRGQGGLVFADLFDGTGKFQALLKKDELAGDEFSLWSDTVDIGDFVEVSGTLFLTKRNEKTLQVKTWRMLAKTLRPLPEKWHGLTDTEERFRKRYLDTLMNEEVRARFALRSRMITEIRHFYNNRDFLEVETPRLQSVAGGATAEPFTTHFNALDMEFYLTIAQELYLKQLIIGGYPRVYEIGRKFRNEGVDVTHNPEFTMLESQEVFADAESQREFIEELMRHVVKKLFGKLSITYDGNEIDFEKPFAVVTFYDLLRRYALVPTPEKASMDELTLKAKQLGVSVEKIQTREKMMDAIYKKAVRPKLLQPTFIVDYPVEMNPFAKRKEEDPTLIDRFQLVAGALEIVNAFSELNNPVDQAERYAEQDKRKRAGEGEISPSDKVYLEAMEYGMPPNGGIGIGIDRLAMLLTDSHNIREVIFFPTLRPACAGRPKDEGEKKELKTAIAVLNRGAKLKGWEEMNTIAHLSASLGARIGKNLLFQEEIQTKDGQDIALNIQHAIMLKEAKSSKELIHLAKEAREQELIVTEFTREMLETTNDKKVIAATKAKNQNEVEYLGVLVFGLREAVQTLTEKFPLSK